MDSDDSARIAMMRQVSDQVKSDCAESPAPTCTSVHLNRDFETGLLRRQ